ncbi:hypothetical protein [[Clostridium] polysaccharolyticum]|uniref:FtsX-like permease family protein n=1 Tax=[Clostridium] polysaccharolyticum TaxID=29364 RepID=A0A1I0DJ69_9FIRM|nr:hypothetical protein [[Clostridium] polysaccharolyticum]SET32484.1 hypothetical protein SAMN04487772_11518 [[Clostridium] polysaccharolyticum]
MIALSKRKEGKVINFNRIQKRLACLTLAGIMLCGTEMTAKAAINADSSNTYYYKKTSDTTTIFLVSLIQLILSFNSYYKIQQKDMGILKYYGFSTKRVQEIYLRGLNVFFLAGLLFLTAYIVALSILTGVVIHYSSVIIFMLSIWIILIFLRFCISKNIVCKYAKRNILFLLKNSKEVE